MKIKKYFKSLLTALIAIVAVFSISTSSASAISKNYGLQPVKQKYKEQAISYYQGLKDAKPMQVWLQYWKDASYVDNEESYLEATIYVKNPNTFKLCDVKVPIDLDNNLKLFETNLYVYEPKTGNWELLPPEAKTSLDFGSVEPNNVEKYDIRINLAPFGGSSSDKESEIAINFGASYKVPEFVDHITLKAEKIKVTNLPNQL
ncbi:MAG: hypothetical protein F6K18_09140 [Okeania sp. SIO2C2]|uniref:hypothetical protein n=1 Tax=Okeania sp. SIO2C2 TaxID=2607787 RepID=UPI0013BB8F43|nr:hypothetical protein [Okeania sp. SIO2C2]NEP86986.1 hypothetical protein [Okeania sp. SIO2C2]